MKYELYVLHIYHHSILKLCPNDTKLNLGVIIWMEFILIVEHEVVMGKCKTKQKINEKKSKEF
jgi:hypothetical protein